jgi:hypothetical protein
MSAERMSPPELHYGTTAVFGVCAALVVLWLLIALGMRPVPAVNEVSRAAL